LADRWGDAGLTGRKIIVDTYGGYSRHGGGAFFWQRSFQGRPLGLLHGALHREETSWAAGLATKAEVQLAYAIGVAEPVFRDGRYLWYGDRPPKSASPRWSAKHFLLTPKGIIEALDLRKAGLQNRPQLTGTSDALARASLGNALTAQMLLRKAAGLGAPAQNRHCGNCGASLRFPFATVC